MKVNLKPDTDRDQDDVPKRSFRLFAPNSGHGAPFISVSNFFRLKSRFQSAKEFVLTLSRSFRDDRCPESAGALAYTSLLALVPLLAVGLTLFTAFPAFEGLTEKLQHFVFSNMVPASGQVVAVYIEGFVENATSLTLPGLLGLLVTALLSMATIEQTFNKIWKVQRKRGLVDTFMVYWAALTVGPILVGVSIATTSYVASLPFLSEAVRSLGDPGLFLKILPVMATVGAFALLYAVVPNQRVPPRHALIGGLVAAILFELAKRGFAFFVTNFPTYEAVYGALAALPIFLVWIYLSWSIILLGAEFTYCLGLQKEEVDA